MPTDEELTPQETAEGEAPPPPPQLTVHWTYMSDGQVQDSGDADCIIGDKALNFRCKTGVPFDVTYADIERVEDEAVKLTLVLRSGGALELTHMARLHDVLSAALMEKWTALNRKQALAQEKLIDSFEGRARRGNEPPAPCGIGVYETAIVMDFPSGQVLRFPLVFSGRPREDDWAFTFDLPGESWTLSHLGRESDRFRAAVESAMSVLETKALQWLNTLCPGIPPFKARGIAPKLLDGKAVAVGELRTLWPALAQAAVKELGDCGLGESWQAAVELGDAEAARVGAKTGLTGGRGEYHWFFLPVVRNDRAFVLMEASAEGSGRATYVFAVPGGPAAMEEAMDALNYALVMVNFRREPIYMTEEQMRKPENAHYLRSVERVPALAALRANYLGKVAHTSPEAWRRGVESLFQ